MEEKIIGFEDKIGEMESFVKENVKSKKIQSQNIQKTWHTMKRSNLQITGTLEGEETQVRGTKNIFNKIIEENFPNQKEMPIKVQETYRAPNRRDQKRNSPQYIIETPNIQTKQTQCGVWGPIKSCKG